MNKNTITINAARVAGQKFIIGDELITTKPSEGRKLTKEQKEKLSTLSIKLLDAGFYGEDLKAIMDRAVALALR